MRTLHAGLALAQSLRSITAVALVLLLVGCLAAMPVQKTASGKAEVTVPGSVGKAAIARIMNEVIGDENFRNYRLKTRSESDVVYERLVDNVQYATLQHVSEITFVTLEVDGKTRIVADVQSYTRDRGIPGPKSEGGSAVRNMAQLLLNRVQASYSQTPTSRDSTPAPAAAAPQRAESPEPPRQTIAPVTATAAQPVSLSTQSMTIAEAQKRLLELGFTPGTPDGNLGPRTVAAISSFQTSRKLARTGKLDEATVQALRSAR